MAAASNIKTRLGIKEGKQKKQINRCSICGKKLKKFIKRPSEHPLVCWQCMIVNNNYADF